ncbi:MAG: hypothetical protein FWD82_01220 [Defluviitaleaceae bacterium]|nr:hypothetical protein [Defluviitaleaceae bacterium]
MSIEKEYKRMKWEGRCPYDSFEEYVDSFFLGFYSSREGTEFYQIKHNVYTENPRRESHFYDSLRGFYCYSKKTFKIYVDF